ncbi:hypothetical protein [Myroides odoratus]|uniref:hypothetical protein n=1 Tax=Myroides odoratus TaxID=256 RepID=UPI00076616F7|nr:hypothetical protein [Myroides odoratus]
MKKLILFSFLATAAVVNTPIHAQEKVKFTKEQIKVMDDMLFDEVFVGVSSKKNSTLLLKDGTKKVGSVSGVSRKKGQITSIKMKDASGKKVEYQADEIEEMYLPISGYVKGAKVASYFGNTKNWGSKSLTKSTNPDEVYVKNITASLKNKKAEKEYLMQLINPSFSSQIEVYADPMASETTSISFGGGPGIGGGVIKSYYIKKGEEVIWLKKGEFEENYNFLFGDNQEFLQKFPYNSIKWDYLSYLIAEYTKMSEEKNA